MIAARALATFCALGLGCGATPPPVVADKAPLARVPDGVVLETPTAPPPVLPVALSGTLVALAEPAPDEAVRDFVFGFFDAFRRRDRGALAALVAEGAVRLEAGAAYGNRDALIDSLASRYRSVDATKLSPADIATLDHIERFTRAELEALGKKRPDAMRDVGLFVRVTMPPLRAGGEKVFDDTVVFVVRVEAGRLKLVTLLEGPAAR